MKCVDYVVLSVGLILASRRSELSMPLPHPPREEQIAEHTVSGSEDGQIGLKQIAGQRHLDQLAANIDIG